MTSMEDMPNEILYNIASYVINGKNKDIFSLKSTNKTLEAISRDLIAQKRPQYAAKMAFMESYLGIMKHLYNGIVNIFSQYGVSESKYYIYYESRSSRLIITSLRHNPFILDRISKILISENECILYVLSTSDNIYNIESDRIECYKSKFISRPLKPIKKLFYKLPRFVHKNFNYLKIHKRLCDDVNSYIKLTKCALIDIDVV